MRQVAHQGSAMPRWRSIRARRSTGGRPGVRVVAGRASSRAIPSLRLGAAGAVEGVRAPHSARSSWLRAKAHSVGTASSCTRPLRVLSTASAVWKTTARAAHRWSCATARSTVPGLPKRVSPMGHLVAADDQGVVELPCHGAGLSTARRWRWPSVSPGSGDLSTSGRAT